MIELIYCAGGSEKFAKIAIDAGWFYGSQLPFTVYYPPYFTDQNWKKPNREKYMEALAQHKPHMATVLDWEKSEQLAEVLGWAEEAAQFVEVVVIIPKVQGGIPLIPLVIGGKPVRLGYSVPTSYGGTPLPYTDFIGRECHLLGGSPNKQIKLRKYLNVQSADCNSHMGMATKFNKFFRDGKWCRLDDFMGFQSDDAPYIAFELSCTNIRQAFMGEKRGTLL